MRNRQCLGVMVLVVGSLAGCDVLNAVLKSNYTIGRAKVEPVVQTESDGYRFIAYVVTWNGLNVVVSDPLARSHHREGDEIQFMAHRIELRGGDRTERNGGRCGQDL